MSVETKQDFSERFQVSERVKSALNSDEEVLWSSETNVTPQLIASMPGVLFMGGFFGIWSAGFFGGISLTLFRSLLIPVAIGVTGFLAPILLFAVKLIYESKREEFAVTNQRIISVTANKMNIDLNSYPRSDIKQVGVEQSIVGDLMGVGNINFEIYQTDMQTDNVKFEGIDDPYAHLEELRDILSEDLE